MARAPKMSTIRRKALSLINQRLDDGSMSTADVLKVLQMDDKAADQAAAAAAAEAAERRGDLVLVLRQDEDGQPQGVIVQGGGDED
jgi:hypothetical protein